MKVVIIPEVWNPYTFTNANTVLIIVLTISTIILALGLCCTPRQYKRSVLMFPLLAFCIFTIISATCLGRIESESNRLNLTLFWTFQKAWTDQSGLHWYYIIGNILLFLPLGFLLPLTWSKLEHWWSVTLIGAILSLAIELTQYITRTGLCELDDLFHNTLGTFTGYQAFVVFRHIIGRNTSQHRSRYHRRLWILSLGYIMGLCLFFAVLLYRNRPDWTGIFY